MKTKTISREVYVTEIKGDYVNGSIVSSSGDTYKNKITVMIEVPEKVISISESDFDRLTSDAYASANVINFVKEKLFGKE